MSEIKKCVFILGMHRSGTSAVAGSFHEYGVDFGNNLMQATNDNPYGYFENLDAFILNESLLKYNAFEWDFISSQKALKSNNSIENDIESFVEEEFANSSIFGLKDPRFCLTLPVWTKVLKSKQIQTTNILVLRNPNEVIQSLVERDGMSHSKAEFIWLAYMLNAYKIFQGNNYEVVEYDELIDNSKKIIKEIGKTAKLNLKKEVGQNFVRPNLKHHSAKTLSNEVTELSKKLYNHLKNKKFSKSLLSESEELWKLFYDDNIIEDFLKKPIEKSSLIIKKECYSVEYMANTFVNLTYTIKNQPEGHIRWVPIKDKFIRITHLKVEFKTQRSKIFQSLSDSRISHNGKGKYGNSIEFDTLEPYVDFDLSGMKSQFFEFRITGQIFTLPFKVFFNKVTTEKEKLAEKLQKANKADKLLIEIMATNKLINQLTADKARLEEREALYELKQKELLEKKNILDVEVQSLLEDKNTLQDKVKNLQGDYRELEEETQNHRQHLEISELKYKNLSKKLQIAERNGKVLQVELTRLSKQLFNIPSAAKWHKVQKLLHMLFRFLRRFKSTNIGEDIFHPFIFIPEHYRDLNPHLGHMSDEELKSHWYHTGHKAGLAGSKCFHVSFYLEHNPDLKSKFSNDLTGAIEHWLLLGLEENRVSSPHFNIIAFRRTFENTFDLKGISNSYLIKYWIEKDNEELAAPRIKKHVVSKLEELKLSYGKECEKAGSTANKLYNTKLNLVQKFSNSLEAPPLVSIVMPCWNRELTIERAVDSVIAQTYSNYELIISDDGSTDNTLNIIKTKYADFIQSGKIKILPNDHRGVSAARNRGIEKANGKYIAYLDSDNAWDKDFLKIMIGILEESKKPSAYCGIVIFNTELNEFKVLLSEYDRERLESSNFIDLNSFVHLRLLSQKLGGFDEDLTRLVDWDLILRYTKKDEPLRVDSILVDYYLQEDVEHITRKENFYNNYHQIREKAYIGHNLTHKTKFTTVQKSDFRLAYVLWEFPVLSETFIMNELRWLINNDYDVKVYHKNDAKISASLDFDIDSVQIENEKELTENLIKDKRNQIHSHFAYPTTTLLAYPASKATGIPFTFTGHGVDIFHEKNIQRMKLKEVASHENCTGVFAIGRFHRLFLLQHGAPESKVRLVPMSIQTASFKTAAKINKPITKSVCCVARFVEKKGIKYLIEAAASLPEVVINIYGYGDEEPHYKELINKYNLSNVFLRGPLNSKEEVIHAVSSHDLFVMPCVRASNQDMDGLPVVFMEALALGVPVVSTDISSIGDIIIDKYTGFLTKPKNPESIVAAVNEFYALSQEEKEQLRKNCQKHVSENYNTDNTMLKLERIWLKKPVDIFLVSYENLPELKEIIRRVFKYTLTPFTLTVVDNNSSKEVKEYLTSLSDLENVNINLLENNIFCGPASNLALDKGKSEFAIYLCSKEAFILDYNWEEKMLQYMRENQNVGIAGHLSYSPSYYRADDLKQHPLFKNFRNQDFADKKSEFRHVQGGVFILRKAMYKEIGGFNPNTPQDMMDVEYSFYAESMGWKLGSIDDVYSLTVKTRPTLNALADENTSVVHPLTLDLLSHYTKVKNKTTTNCNICDWSGEKYVAEQEFTCPSCSSTNFDRSVFRILAESATMYRKLKLLEINPSGYNNTEIRKAFEYHSINIMDSNIPHEYTETNWDVVVVNTSEKNDEVIRIFAQNLTENGFILSTAKHTTSESVESVYHFSKVNKYLLKPIYQISKIHEHA